MFDHSHPIPVAPELHGEPYITDGGRTKVYFHAGQNREERIRIFEEKRGQVIVGAYEHKHIGNANSNK